MLAAVAIAATAAALQGQLDAASGHRRRHRHLASRPLFLLAIGLANLFVLRRRLGGVPPRAPAASSYVDEDLDALLAGGGLLARLFRPLFRRCRRSWHMYPLGFLFGLGFDTATEIGLLGISAAQAAQGLSLWSILVFPALFTAGMALVDTTDSVLMVGAYGWAFVNPMRKL